MRHLPGLQRPLRPQLHRLPPQQRQPQQVPLLRPRHQQALLHQVLPAQQVQLRPRVHLHPQVLQQVVRLQRLPRPLQRATLLLQVLQVLLLQVHLLQHRQVPQPVLQQQVLRPPRLQLHLRPVLLQQLQVQLRLLRWLMDNR